MKTKLISILWISLGVVLWNTTSMAWAEECNKTIEIKDKADVTIEMRSSDVEVVGWEKNIIKVQASCEVINGIEAKGDTIRISYKTKMDDFIYHGSEEVLVYLPKNTRVMLTTISGKQKIKQVEDRVKLNTISGDVDVSDVSGSLSIKAVSADVELNGSKRGLMVETVSGDIEANKVSGTLVEVQTVSGDVVFDRLQAEQVRIKTVSGEMKINGAFPENGKVVIKSVSGDANLVLLENAGFEVSLKTHSGDLSSDFALSSQQESRKHKSGKFGSGGVEISMKSLSGDLRISKKKD
jgi:DUF4097 and DUF4098 domain-containing protein YvlB